MLASLPVDALLRHLPWMVFVFLFGACVGSFINVVNWRLPRGMSLTQPASRCPTCGGRLRFFRENVPIIGWLILRGKCRYCGVRISPVYPIVETAMALFFVLLYICYFMGEPNTWLWDIGGPWWSRQHFALGWPAWTAIAFLFAGLFSMTVIDARTYLIPLAIPTFVTVAAICLWVVQAMLAREGGVGRASWPIPCTGWMGTGAALGGIMGVGTSMLLLTKGIFTQSFADYEEYVSADEPLADYPHARREMGKELLFLTPIILGGILGAWILGGLDGVPPRWLQAVGGSLGGWLLGGGLVWAVRMVGTLCFGREAMGLGDVHLLAAVGAVFGWFLPLIIFFVAPFIGLAWTLAAALGSRFQGGVKRELPYGPHLAAATILVVLGQAGVAGGWRIILPTVEMPEAGLVVPVDKSEGWTAGGSAVSMPLSELGPPTEGTTARCGKETKPCV